MRWGKITQQRKEKELEKVSVVSTHRTSEWMYGCSGEGASPSEATYQVPLLGKLGICGLLVHIPLGPSLCHLLFQP